MTLYHTLEDDFIYWAKIVHVNYEGHRLVEASGRGNTPDLAIDILVKNILKIRG